MELHGKDQWTTGYWAFFDMVNFLCHGAPNSLPFLKSSKGLIGITIHKGGHKF